ncbi:hypothetical protein NEOLEDRAFT_1027489, partial [Neolentinus lepideus HHB14362 ss-1]
ELKLSTPKDYDGKREELRGFLLQVRLYLKANQEIYNSDDKKILFVLSHLKGGTAGPWAETYVYAHIQDGDIIFEMFNEFIAEFQEAFEEVNTAGEALNKLRTMKQAGKTANEFISEFKI